jgi:hypothetical protein
LVASQKTLMEITEIANDGTPRYEIFLNPATTNDQELTVSIAASKFPAWTRGKTIAITSLTVLTVSWEPGDFVIQPQAPLPSAGVNINMTPVAGSSVPNVCSATIPFPPGVKLGGWSFKIKQASAADFHSLTKDLIGDVILMLSYDAS